MSAVAAHGDIDIVAEEAAERDVPAPPEVGDGEAAIGMVEILLEVKAKASAYAYCHVGIA